MSVFLKEEIGLIWEHFNVLFEGFCISTCWWRGNIEHKAARFLSRLHSCACSAVKGGTDGFGLVCHFAHLNFSHQIPPFFLIVLSVNEHSMRNNVDAFSKFHWTFTEIDPDKYLGSYNSIFFLFFLPVMILDFFSS